MSIISRNKLAGDVLFIGVGLAGCRAANAIQQLGYECHYINTSVGDFDALKDITRDMTYPIPKAKGCNKNMALAYSIVSEYISDIFTRIDASYRKYQHIYFIFSTGGGTGAGSAPAIAEYFAQRYAGVKSIGLIPILPSKDDNAISSQNTKTCLEYIQTHCTSITSIILVDNEAEDKFIINKELAEQIDQLLALPENKNAHQETDELKSADEQETLELLSTPGYVHIAKINAPTNKSGDTEPYVIDSIPYSPKPDTKNCISIGVSISERKLSDFNPMHLYKCFGRPNSEVKAGFSKSDTSYVYVFGTEFPSYLYVRYDNWLDEFEEEKESVETKNGQFQHKQRAFLSSNRNIIKPSAPFATKEEIDSILPPLPKTNPFSS